MLRSQVRPALACGSAIALTFFLLALCCSGSVIRANAAEEAAATISTAIGRRLGRAGAGRSDFGAQRR